MSTGNEKNHRARGRHSVAATTVAVVATALAGLGLAACSGGGSGQHSTTAAAAMNMPGMNMSGMDMPATGAPLRGPAVATDKVTINNFAFMPQIVTVPAGTAVTWTNMDEEPHTVVDGAQGIESPVMGNQGSTYTHVFTTPGTYDYNCSIHPFMHGVVVVTA
jgi:plastocyanin